MRCGELERRLEAWLAGELPPTERATLERHLETCGECRDLVELAGWADAAECLGGGDGGHGWDGGDGGDGAEPPADLVLGVLERTSGRVCARAREDLVPLVDGELPVERRELVALHLEGCPECRELHGVLEELPGDLVRLAEVDPGPGFVDGVLERTVRADGSAARTEAPAAGEPSVPERLRRWWAATWPALVRRPRFALEAAYVLALLLMPLVASADLPERAADLVGRAGRAGAVKVATAAQELAEGAGGVAERAGSLGAGADAELRTFRKRLASSLEKGRDPGPNDPNGPDGPSDPDDPDDPNPPKGEAP